jgi:hypothetical protein
MHQEGTEAIRRMLKLRTRLECRAARAAFERAASRLECNCAGRTGEVGMDGRCPACSLKVRGVVVVRWDADKIA